MASAPASSSAGGGGRAGAAGLTSTTAPGKTFSSRSELAQHYKSDWHRYNLKRREAGLPVLGESDFNARLEAAVAARKEREERERGAGRGHLKAGKSGKKKKDKKGKGGGKRLGGGSQAAAPDGGAATKEEGDSEAKGVAGAAAVAAEEAMETEERPEQEEEEEEPPNIDPYQSLFDSRTFPTLALNLEHMSKSYGFFVADSEYLSDLEGLLGYCQEKVKLGRMCLYCQRSFRSWEACQRHMIDSRHCKLRYERGIDLEEFDVFYDFSEADAEFLTGAPRRKAKSADAVGTDYMEEGEDEDDDDDSAEWEDISDDEGVEDADMDENKDDEDEDEDMYGYEAELATHGYDITPLGELVFPDGRIVGHRGLARYYKQNVREGPSETSAVVAAKRAAGERVFGGRVYRRQDEAAKESTLALMRAGLDPASAARGRAGDGILVAQGGSGSGGGGGNFTALSLYRYRAAVRKSKRDEDKGRRLKQKSFMNTNRMDKKANRLMNGVSVAHAAR